jgi:hypothetical protein
MFGWQDFAVVAAEAIGENLGKCLIRIAPSVPG